MNDDNLFVASAEFAPKPQDMERLNNCRIAPSYVSDPQGLDRLETPQGPWYSNILLTGAMQAVGDVTLARQRMDLIKICRWSDFSRWCRCRVLLVRTVWMHQGRVVGLWIDDGSYLIIRLDDHRRPQATKKSPPFGSASFGDAMTEVALCLRSRRNAQAYG